MYYKQCTLKKDNIYQTVWIPEIYAHIGQILEIKQDNGWLVTEVGQIRMLEEDVSMHSQDYKHQRKMSDI